MCIGKYKNGNLAPGYFLSVHCTVKTKPKGDGGSGARGASSVIQ